MFTDTLRRWVEAIADTTARRNLFKVCEALFDRESSCALNSAGLAIHGAASAVVKTGGSDCYLLADGVLQKIASATDLAALSGTVTNTKYNVFCFFIDSGGAVTSAMGTEGASLAALKFPQFPSKKALIGFVIIHPTGTGNFVGGTTALDDGTVVPNAVYVNAIGGFDPYVLIG